MSHPFHTYVNQQLEERLQRHSAGGLTTTPGLSSQPFRERNGDGRETGTHLVLHPKRGAKPGRDQFFIQKLTEMPDQLVLHPRYIALPRALHSIRPKFNRIQQPPKHGSIANQSASTLSKIAASSIQLARGTRVGRSTHHCDAVCPGPGICNSRRNSLLVGL